ncbi:SUKH-4 family immunity protein [Streptomyces sp. NPDC046931]|uniref:SUKH-4 family immunity protein n=1 Tax=Streptomyces sp. NPDC046931 TaxID=3154806 RepID=UPI0033F91046
MTRTLKRFSRPPVQFIVERSSDRPWVLAPGRNDIVLSPPPSDEDRCADLARLLELHPPLWVLAAAELRAVSLPVWAELCRCLGVQASAGQLEELTETRTELLATSEVAGAVREVGFRAESDRYRLRRLHTVDHGSLLASLLRRLHTQGASSNNAADPLARYAAQAVGLHAAQAGLLEDVLADGSVLANLEAAGLLQGIAATWPSGVPQMSIATDIHYLEQLGLAAAPHEEWVAWLHHCALNRDDERLARAIATESGVALPWRTVWTNCRPFGTFGRFREPTAERSDAPSDQRFGAQELVSLLAESHSWPLLETGPRVRHIFDGREDAFRPFRSKRLAESEWFVVGPSGPFVVNVNSAASQQPHLTALPAPFVGPITQAGLWNCPPQALAEGAPDRAWLESTFGMGTCRPLSQEDLPPGLSDSDSRNFLTSVGLPALSEQLPFFRTADLGKTGLVQVQWPADADLPNSEGPFYYLGEWTGGRVLLDGSTGAVVQDYSTGYSSVAVATGLRQFCILLRLYHEFLISDFSTPDERRDARHSLRQWAEEIDPVVIDADHWEQVLDGDLDNWGTE